VGDAAKSYMWYAPVISPAAWAPTKLFSKEGEV